jgi:zinc/manganese transport system substrate-binding protein
VTVRRPTRPLLLALLGLVALVAAACGSDRTSDPADAPSTSTAVDVPTVVVTHPVLGAVVAELVGDEANVEVLMPDGADPHDFRPSARDVERLTQADLVVANGLGLEEGLEDALDQAEADGTPVFRAADHVTLRTFDADDGEADHEDAAHEDEDEHDHAHEDEAHADEGHADEGEAHEDEGHDDHGHGAEDPHFWVDPLAMAQVVPALAVELQTHLGLDLTERAQAQVVELEELDARSRSALAVIPAERRLLVTGHESMGYFADRYDLVLVGALIPSTSSQAAASASGLADLRAQIDATGVPVVFNEVGTPPALAAAIAEETGAEVVELPTHGLPEAGSYASFIDEIVDRVVAGLAP